MKDNDYNEETLRKFLLGDVSDDVRDAIEDRFLTDEEFSARLLVVEDETIENYLRHELSAQDKELFEKAFLTNPRRRERVLAVKGVIAASNAEADLKTTKEKSASLWSSILAFFRFETSFAGYAFAAVALLVLFGAWFLVSRLNQNNDNRIAQVNTNQRQDNAESTPKPSPVVSISEPASTPSPQPSPTPQLQKSSEPTFATMVLRPTLLRDPNSAAKFILAPSVKRARIQLNLERDDYKSYVVRITTVEGNPVWQGGPLYARRMKTGKAIIFNLSTKLLPDNDYIIELSGVSEAGPMESFADYFVSVTRE